MKKRPRASFLTVGQAAAVVGVSPSTLRLWERAGLVAPARNTGRYRLYSPDELDVLKRIKSLRDVEHLNVAGIRHALGQHRPGPSGSLESVGPRLRRLRQQAGLRLAQAAQRAGVSPSFLSGVERSLATASVATVQRLAAAYGSNVLELFGLPSQPNRLLGPGDRQVLEAHPGVRVELLSTGATRLEAMLFCASPRAGSAGPYAHAGEELVYVLSGSIEIWLDEFEHYLLRAGDSFWFESTRGHRWVNASATDEATLMWVCWRVR